MIHDFTRPGWFTEFQCPGIVYLLLSLSTVQLENSSLPLGKHTTILALSLFCHASYCNGLQVCRCHSWVRHLAAFLLWGLSGVFLVLRMLNLEGDF